MRALRSGLLALCGCAFAAAALAADEPLLDYTVSPRDTLIGLSTTVFESAQAWREIAALNKLRDPNRIYPGQVLRVPARLMRFRPASARLLSVTGDVRVAGAAAAAGDVVNEGQSLETGSAGSAVVELADGTRMRMPPASLAEVVANRHYGGTATADAAPGASAGWFAGALRLLRGSVEVFASKVLRAKPLEVTTPTAVVGVRGTTYRVRFDDEAGSSTRAEVLDGNVRFDAASGPAGADLNPGFGAAIAAGASAPTVVELARAPDLGAVPERFERPLLRFTLPAESTVVRVQVAADEGFDRIVSDQLVPAGSEIRIAGLDDATWQLRARRVDSQGVEGFDAQRAFVLKARPEPPASAAPRASAKQTVGNVDFAWAPNVDSKSVRLQVAREASFSQPLVDQAGITADKFSTALADEGDYFWRMASVRGEADQGPFGDPQRFELRPLPEPPKGGMAEDGKSLVLNWGGRPQDRQRVELASDPEFTNIVAQDELASPQWAVPRPSKAGLYYFRYRSVEPDGFVSPYSQALKIEVPRDWRWMWMLTPLLLVL
jgi:hypothetical protein